MERFKKIVLTIGVTAFAFLVNYGINFLLTPYITQNVGTEAYGYVSLAKTLASYANIVTIALNGYASRFIAVEYHNKNYKMANTYFSSVAIADGVLGCVILFLAIIFSINIESFFVVSSEILSDVKVLFILVFLNLAVTLSATVLQAAGYIANKLDAVSIGRLLSYFVEAGILVLCYTLFSARVSFVGVGIIGASLTVILINVFITRKYTPQIHLRLSYFSLTIVKKLVIKGIWNSVNSLGNLLNTGLDLVITNLLLSPLAMGQLSIVKSITTIFSNVFQMVSNPFQPLFLQDYAVHDKRSLLKDINMSMKLCGMIANIALAGFVSLGRLYYTLWLPNQDINLLYKLTVISIISGVAEGAMYPLYYIYTLTVKNKVPSVITIAGGVLNVTGMYVLITYTSMGIYAVQLTTTVIMLVINLITNPIYMAYCLDIKWYTFYPTLLRHIFSCGVMVVVMLLLSKLIAPQSWIGLILTALVEVVVGCVVHFMIALDNGEKKKIYIWLKAKSIIRH